MPSSYNYLGIELMATGENAGTWGTKTNTNLDIIEQISGGYITQAIAGTGTTAFEEDDGSTGALIATRVIVFTGALSGTRIVTFPVGVENFYIIKNATTEAYTLQLKAATGSGSTVTWATDDKGWKLVYFDGVATNTGVVEPGFSTTAGDVTLTGTQTLTNKTLTSPKIGTSILDTNGLQLALLTATGSAVNEFTLANAATGSGPTISSTGGDSNIDINITPKGTGDVVLAGDTVSVGDSGAAATLRSNGAGTLTVTTGGTENLILSTNNGTASGTITITDAANQDILIAPNGYGRATFSGQGAIQGTTEKMTIEATAATGTKNYDALTQAVWYYTSAATGNWTLNIRADGSTALNLIMDTGESLSLAHLVTQTGTAYYNNVVQVDGSTVTPEWQGGSAPSAGNINSVDVYTYTVIKTADATFTVLASQTQFA